ncbi:acetate/propionate family kinase [Niveibacterium sp. 24ML]|uniref:acetate/propionate family kinase n=1 Tax=Niveibacterium sp. 24ML TaxID=2985512 RepID=UPI002270A57B|nr:acetate/propionate family kinase [Niveibacterium sp. 24ML]MCX9154876.1 acetate/propionate family kinase [Niveibacterium sp. 24ML]
MTDAIVVLNAGSSSLKFSVFAVEDGEINLRLRGQLEGLFTSPKFVGKTADGKVLGEHAWPEGHQLGHEGAMAHLTAFLDAHTEGLEIKAIGHRVVHGGVEFAEPVRLDPATLKRLEAFVPLAPLHQPNNLLPIRLLLESGTKATQVACFDTAFHRDQPLIAQMYALPHEMTAAGIRRYGFHGLSYEFIASVMAQHDERAAKGRTVVFHLGNGASMCAVENGRSVATTMGFTAVDGLPMGTRCGSVDPGVLLYLMDQRGMDARAIEKLIYHRSGLLGMSGISSDCRALEESDERNAKLALDHFCYRAARELASLAATMGGVDAVVFTAGIGENSPTVRAKILEQAAWLGIDLDVEANNCRGFAKISTAASKVNAWVIPTNEELMIARHAWRVVHG